MTGTVNLIKLCVGAESPDDLIAWQEMRRKQFPERPLRHVTRMWPKREAELVNGGSLYWVFKGSVLARQKILRLDEVIGEDGIRRCGIVFEPGLIRTYAMPRRPFQGWRYLNAEDAPEDMPEGREGEQSLPQDLADALNDIGLR